MEVASSARAAGHGGGSDGGADGGGGDGGGKGGGGDGGSEGGGSHRMVSYPRQLGGLPMPGSHMMKAPLLVFLKNWLHMAMSNHGALAGS